MRHTNNYRVNYTKANGQESYLIVQGLNEKEAIGNAKFLCFTGKNFRDAKLTEEKYIKITGGSHRAN